MGKGAVHRFFDGVEAVGYGVGTVALGTTTAGLGVAMGLSMCTGVGIPVGLLIAPLVLGSYYGTAYTGSKTKHKVSHVMGGHELCHSLTDAKEAVKAVFK